METRKNDRASSQSSVPPSPPPPPPPPPAAKVSIALKVRRAPPGWAFERHVQQSAGDFTTPPAGTYFFYGTLQDPGILGEVLGLPSPPLLRPAYLIGHDLKLWGQYPAMANGSAGTVVEGSAFNVADEAAAGKLACYETKNYQPAPCIIRFRDGGDQIEGYAFRFCGNPNDLSEGSFDLALWLQRMGR
ncbi:hypothetical protein LTR36_009707 [Oleoguttula mirabilis]|uniref:Putative gamma-glutamylcyclotransferase n=1 Tax=Oleoguttula mirabilis TaxID=1507867 RepID=A0AAV9J5F9_9PEZI|nr:hypothetical protein LTR36_009707 [Oleoguttula mirabilis]